MAVSSANNSGVGMRRTSSMGKTLSSYFEHAWLVLEHLECSRTMRSGCSCKTQRAALSERPFESFSNPAYSVDSISKPHASSKGSGMYFEFLFRRAHSRKRVERKY